jgi:hypothetical protein
MFTSEQRFRAYQQAHGILIECNEDFNGSSLLSSIDQSLDLSPIEQLLALV